MSADVRSNLIGGNEYQGNAVRDAHVIRLRGPWHYRVLQIDQRLEDGNIAREPAPDDLVGTIKMPADWSGTLGEHFRGCVRYTRHFHRPTGLSHSTQVALVVEAVDAQAKVAFNGHELGEIVWPSMPATFDITSRLLSRNELNIDVDLPQLPGVAAVHSLRPPERKNYQAGGLVGEVWLEIR